MNYLKLSRLGLIVSAMLVSLALRPTASAEVSISGHVESTYMYDFNRPDKTSRLTGLRTYDKTPNSFYLNAAHIALAGELKDGVGFVVEVDHGSDAAVNNNVDGVQTDVQEAYLNFPVGPLSATAGKFVTYEGIEVIEGPDNPTVSRGYLYGIAEAFTHVGGKVHLPIGSIINIGVGLVNGRDDDVNSDDGLTAIWRVGLDFGEKFAIGFSGSHGNSGASDNPLTTPIEDDDDQITSFDVTGSVNMIPRLAINFQWLWAGQQQAKVNPRPGYAHLTGVGVQPVLTIVPDVFDIGARIEYIDNWDSGGYVATNYTITPTVYLNEVVTVRAELRYDDANTAVGFPKKFSDDKAGLTKNNTTTASLNIIYKFE